MSCGAPTDISAHAYGSPLNFWRLFALLCPAFCGIVACCPRVTRIDQQPLPLMASPLVHLAATPLDACQTRLTTQMKRVVISGDATAVLTQSWSMARSRWPIVSTHCSRSGCAFSSGSHRPRRFRYGGFVFDQADGNARVDTAEVAWRTAEAELDVGKNPGVLVLTIHCAFTLLSLEFGIVYFIVGYSPAWTLAFGRRRRGTQVLLFRQKVTESSQAHHAVHVNRLRLPLPLRLLCFGILWVCGTWLSFTASTVGPTFLEVSRCVNTIPQTQQNIREKMATRNE